MNVVVLAVAGSKIGAKTSADLLKAVVQHALMAASSNTWRRYFITKTKWIWIAKTQLLPRLYSLESFIGQMYPSYVLIRKAHIYRLYPTLEQAALLARWVGAVRCVYNLALEQRRDWYRPGRKFNFASQCRGVTALAPS